MYKAVENTVEAFNTAKKKIKKQLEYVDSETSSDEPTGGKRKKTRTIKEII